MMYRRLWFGMALGFLVTFGAAADPWEDYRRLHPFHVQEIAVSPPDADGMRHVIVAEPPPKMGQEVSRMRDVLERAFGVTCVGGITLRRHPILVDGWVRDVVAELLPACTREANGAELIDEGVLWLNWYLFGTSDGIDPGAVWRDVKVPFDKAPPNIMVNLEDELAWLNDSNRIFVDAYGSTKGKLAEILAIGRPGVYATERPELVAWVFDPVSSMGNHNEGSIRKAGRYFRRFTMEADIIVGAVRTSSGGGPVAIIGRSRQVPVAALPPLRYETMQRLAAIAWHEPELGQSYERNAIFAGKLEEDEYEGQKGWDWAPIYLSAPLEDTEFGSLLNIADQLLKSRSLASEIRYIGFDYPPQKEVAFGKRLDDRLQEEGIFTSSILFNWNTDGAAQTLLGVDDHGLQLAVPFRTGSLPVTYGSEHGEGEFGPNKELKAFEETAWDYFSSLRDPNLVRVVQYTFLYQVFREWGVRGEDWTPPVGVSPRQRVQTVIADAVDRAIGLLISDDDLRSVIITPEMTNELEGLSNSERESAEAFLDLLVEVSIEPLQEFRRDVRRSVEVLGPRFRKTLVDVLTAPRDHVPDAAAFGRVEVRLQSVQEKTKQIDWIVQGIADDAEAQTVLAHYFAIGGLKEAVELVADVAALPKAIIKAAEREPREGHVKTPSIVVSKDLGRDGDFSVGGHNLNASIPILRVDPTVPIGRPQLNDAVEGALEVRVNPADLRRARNLPRIAARNRDLGSQRLTEVMMESLPAKSPPPISLAEALHLDQGRALRLATTTVSQDSRVANLKKEAIQMQPTQGGHVITVTRSTDGKIFAVACCRGKVHAVTSRQRVYEIISDMQSNVSNDNSMRVVSKNFSVGEVDALLRSVANDSARLREHGIEPSVAGLGGGSQRGRITATSSSGRHPSWLKIFMSNSRRDDLKALKPDWDAVVKQGPSAIRELPPSQIPDSLREALPRGNVDTGFYEVSIPLRQVRQQPSLLMRLLFYARKTGVPLPRQALADSIESGFANAKQHGQNVEEYVLALRNVFETEDHSVAIFLERSPTWWRYARRYQATVTSDG